LPSFREWYELLATRGIHLATTDFFTTTRTNYAFWKSGV
jgi:hypothetical protein